MSSRASSYVKLIIKFCQNAINIRESLGKSYEDFLEEISAQYSISFCIEQIGELARKLREDEYTGLPKFSKHCPECGLALQVPDNIPTFREVYGQSDEKEN